MAILLVNIENEKSLPLNEFFDYNGVCYASTRSREKNDTKEVIDMTAFYEAAVNTEVLRDVPVVFVSASASENDSAILGWYRKAEIHHKMLTPSLFLEGNIKAYASDAVWLPKDEEQRIIFCAVKKQLYEVIEEEDERFTYLQNLIENYANIENHTNAPDNQSNMNQFIRYHSADVHTIPQAMKELSTCKAACEQWAGLVAREECQDIRDMKTLEVYAKKLCEKDRKNAEGYYYLALAYYHLGFVKEGLKQVNKALQLEKDDPDFLALKGLLLVSRGYIEDGAAHLHKAYEGSQYEAYLLMEGRAYMMADIVDKAYDCFEKVEDDSLLETMGIKRKDMESKFHFIKMKYRQLRDMIWKR